jgi:PAS domain S-box-containing protein
MRLAQASPEHQAHLWFLECMDRINRAIQGTNDLERMMSDVLDEVLAIFDCDRAWLVYPCDPGAPSFRVPMERTRPEYPGALALDLEVPMDAVSARTIRMLLEADGAPVRFDSPDEGPLSEEWAQRLSIRSQIAMAVYPKTGKPYAFGLHQCSRPRVWTSLEERLFLEVGRRLADALSSLLAYRDLRDHEQLLQAVVDHSSAVIYVKDLQGRFLLVNRRFAELFHVDPKAAQGRTDYDFLPAEFADDLRDFDRRVIAAGEVREAEETVPHDDGLHTYISIKCPLIDASGQAYAVCGISTDITERKRIEEATRLSLREKEALLKEVHHRVKNNLQIISSLLALQSRHVAASSVQEVLAESQSRVRSMALVHEALYRSPSLADVELAPYIESLCAHLYRSYGIDSRRIALRISIPELTLDLDRAIPCGLLVNELVSNALKHAFPLDRTGAISVELVVEPGVAYRLVVADDGVGLPDDLVVHDAPSLGLQLVASLADQLRGTLDVESARGRGTAIAISFTR